MLSGGRGTAKEGRGAVVFTRILGWALFCWGRFKSCIRFVSYLLSRTRVFAVDVTNGILHAHMAPNPGPGQQKLEKKKERK